MTCAVQTIWGNILILLKDMLNYDNVYININKSDFVLNKKITLKFSYYAGPVFFDY